jgi:hypothetical protein
MKPGSLCVQVSGGLLYRLSFVYLYDGKDATEITGPLSLDVIDSCIENIEEGDIE